MYKFIILVSFIGLYTAGCQVIELGPELNEAENNQTIEGPRNTPTSLEQFQEYLFGTDSKTWQASGFTLAGISGFQNCRLDDRIEIRADGTYEYQSGDQLCGAEDQLRQRSGNWSLLFEERLIQFETGTGETFEALILGLDPQNIVLSSSYMGLAIEASYRSN